MSAQNTSEAASRPPWSYYSTNSARVRKAKLAEMQQKYTGTKEPSQPHDSTDVPKSSLSATPYPHDHVLDHKESEVSLVSEPTLPPSHPFHRMSEAERRVYWDTLSNYRGSPPVNREHASINQALGNERCLGQKEEIRDRKNEQQQQDKKSACPSSGVMDRVLDVMLCSRTASKMIGKGSVKSLLPAVRKAKITKSLPSRRAPLKALFKTVSQSEPQEAVRSLVRRKSLMLSVSSQQSLVENHAATLTASSSTSEPWSVDTSLPRIEGRRHSRRYTTGGGSSPRLHAPTRLSKTIRRAPGSFQSESSTGTSEQQVFSASTSMASLEEKLRNAKLEDLQQSTPDARRHIRSLFSELDVNGGGQTRDVAGNGPEVEGSTGPGDSIVEDMIRAARRQSYAETEDMVKKRLGWIDEEAERQTRMSVVGLGEDEHHAGRHGQKAPNSVTGLPHEDLDPMSQDEVDDTSSRDDQARDLFCTNGGREHSENTTDIAGTHFPAPPTFNALESQGNDHIAQIYSPSQDRISIISSNGSTIRQYKPRIPSPIPSSPTLSVTEPTPRNAGNGISQLLWQAEQAHSELEHGVVEQNGIDGHENEGLSVVNGNGRP